MPITPDGENHEGDQLYNVQLEGKWEVVNGKQTLEALIEKYKRYNKKERNELFSALINSVMEPTSRELALRLSKKMQDANKELADVRITACGNRNLVEIMLIGKVKEPDTRLGIVERNTVKDILGDIYIPAPEARPIQRTVTQNDVRALQLSSNVYELSGELVKEFSRGKSKLQDAFTAAAGRHLDTGLSLLPEGYKTLYWHARVRKSGAELPSLEEMKKEYEQYKKASALVDQGASTEVLIKWIKSSSLREIYQDPGACTFEDLGPDAPEGLTNPSGQDKLGHHGFSEKDEVKFNLHEMPGANCTFGEYISKFYITAEHEGMHRDRAKAGNIIGTTPLYHEETLAYTTSLTRALEIVMLLIKEDTQDDMDSANEILKAVKRDIIIYQKGYLKGSEHLSRISATIMYEPLTEGDLEVGRGAWDLLSMKIKEVSNNITQIVKEQKEHYDHPVNDRSPGIAGGVLLDLKKNMADLDSMRRLIVDIKCTNYPTQ